MTLLYEGSRLSKSTQLEKSRAVTGTGGRAGSEKILELEAVPTKT